MVRLTRDTHNLLLLYMFRYPFAVPESFCDILMKPKKLHNLSTYTMKRILRAIEAIPLHLTVNIIRFDDALGESWGLPLQACDSWR